MFKTADKKGNTISKLFKNLLAFGMNKVDKALFNYQVKTGLILCAIEGEENGNEQAEIENVEDENNVDENGEENVDEESEEVVVSIEGESPPPEEEDETKAAPWIKELRKSQRELQKRNRELEDKLKASAPVVVPVTLGVKPTLESCEYDAEEYERKLEAWHDTKLKANAEELKKQNEAEQANQAWQNTLTGYGKAKTELKVKDFEEAEDVVKETLSVTQQGIILQGSKNAALLVYALGKNPKKAKEMASINDPVKFAFAVANLENQLKVTNRKAPPPPESSVRSNTGISGAVDSQLERLRNEAEKSGDYSKVTAYRNQQRNKAK